jgi:hypothetical protein
LSLAGKVLAGVAEAAAEVATEVDEDGVDVQPVRIREQIKTTTSSTMVGKSNFFNLVPPFYLRHFLSFAF